jgi:hypothetical protein
LLLKDLSVLQEGAARGKSSWFLGDIIEKRLRGAMGQHKPELTLDKSATYRIVWQGHLDESWSDYIGGLTISTGLDEDHHSITILTGQVKDQAMLMGILSAVYDWHHMPLLSVECISLD